MAKKAKKSDDGTEFGPAIPNGASFTIVQLERDLVPRPQAQRIVQTINWNGEIKAYISENAYHRNECLEHFMALVRKSYENSIKKGGIALYGIKGRIHWHEFTEEFCLKGKHGVRLNPENGEPEQEGETVNVIYAD